MKNIKYITLIVTTSLLLSGCLTTTKETTPPKNIEATPPTTQTTNAEPSLQFEPTWTEKLEALKPALRSCIVTHKSTTIIRYATQINPSQALIILGELSGKQLDCVADSNKASTPKITQSAHIIPQNIPSFYPVGRSIGQCTDPTTQKNNEGHVMGTVCATQ